MALNLDGKGVGRFLDSILIRKPFLVDLSPFEGITSEDWVRISGFTNSESSRCFELKGESEGRVSSMCCGKHWIVPKEVWFRRL